MRSNEAKVSSKTLQKLLFIIFCKKKEKMKEMLDKVICRPMAAQFTFEEMVFIFIIYSPPNNAEMPLVSRELQRVMVRLDIGG